ncbi:MAG TPA: hypothetical protein VHU84_05485, partial [Lacipirellulaceae bacterium]|nr:hypothetical protein [Lacipirellulaceae bacterium]
NPLAPVVDYQSMLNRIFWFVSVSALVAVWMLRLNNSALDAWLRQIDFNVEFGGNKTLPVPGGYLFPALAVGIVTRIFRLHARISDVLGIRESFDIQVIIAEFAHQVGIDLLPITYEQLVERRPDIMRQAFYAYVSGSQPIVDQHLVEQALDAWSWFWVGVEGTFIFMLAGLGLVGSGVFATGLQTLGGAMIFAAIGLPAMRNQCRRYAVAQVRAIVGDPVRAAAVRATFADLKTERFILRRAA